MPDSLNARNVIVTGATGWLGQRVIMALQGQSPDPAMPRIEAGSITALVAPGEPTAALLSQGVACVSGDLRDPATLAPLFQKAQDAVLLHLAGLIHPRLRTADFMAVNYQGTMNVMAAAAKAGVARAVIMSSNSPIGYNRAPDQRFDETSPYQPYMGYGRSKQRMEQAVTAAYGDGQGPAIVMVRAPWFYGPGQPPRQTLFFEMIRDGKFPLLGTGQQQRSMGYVDNLAQGIMRAAMAADGALKTYWLADERPYPMLEIIETVQSVLRDNFDIAVTDKILRLPGVIADGARLADWGLQTIGLYHQKIHVLSEMNLTIACDISRAKQELGYQPTISLRQGMRNSIHGA